MSAALAKGAAMELYLTPKPGLVDLADSGSHPDLSLQIMERSIKYVSEYLNEIVNSLTNNEPFICQKNIGIQAEQRLIDDLGTNTHKGFIFLSGMLLIARWHANSAHEQAIRKALSTLASDFFKIGEEKLTNGQQARNKYNSGGIVLESINGFPSVFEQALPVFRQAMKQHSCLKTASFATLARLMQKVEDTTTLHRAGSIGLSRVQSNGRKLEEIIAKGDNFLAHLQELNLLYIKMNITIGGIADMLGLTFGYLIASGEISESQTHNFRVNIQNQSFLNQQIKEQP